jgi:hypothetical protein
VLQDFLAISPEAEREEWEQVFQESRERWELQSVVVDRKPLRKRKTKKKPVSPTAVSGRKDCQGPDVWKAFDEAGLNLISAAPAVVPPPMLIEQWEIARCLARVRPRQAASCSDLCQRLITRLDHMAAATDKLFYHWVKVGRLLGQAYLDCWLPQPAKFRDYLPKSLHDLSRYPEMDALSGDRLFGCWRRTGDRWRRLTEIRAIRGASSTSNFPVDPGGSRRTHERDRSSYQSPDIPWCAFLSRWCLKKYRWLLVTLDETSKGLASKGKQLSSDGFIPPLVVLTCSDAIVLGKRIAVKLTSAEHDVLKELEAA